MNRVLSLASICLGLALSLPAKAQTGWPAVDMVLTRKRAVSGDVLHACRGNRRSR